MKVESIGSEEMTNSANALVKELVKNGCTLDGIHRMSSIPKRSLIDILEGKIKHLEYNNFKKLLYFYCKHKKIRKIRL